ncbi:RNA polymerase sigma factor [Candidatus Uabimicrobium sp. HlEnr_7]|uniref:RNA polymerase sigma factor n=1 Tax=Candidatus Uabimicrobium helgolandensis TaxID=3095367 RepID=UPI0035591CE4
MTKEKSFLEKLDEISTHADDIKHLGNPEHKKYQQCWRNFYFRYHNAILSYIKKQTRGQLQIHDVEDIASKVYERGFRWNFQRQHGIRFRVLLKQVVKDAIWQFWQGHNKKIKYEQKNLELVSANEDIDYSENLSAEIFSTLVNKVLQKFPEKQRKVLRWIWTNGKWPPSEILANLIDVSSNNIENARAAARQWKKRNVKIWERFQKQICNEIELLAIGEENQQQELQYFTSLSV